MISKIRFIRIKIYLVKFFIINYTQIFFYYVGVAKIDQKKYLHQFSCFSSLSVIMSEIMLILLMNSFGRLLPIISTKYLHFQNDNTPFTELNLFKNSDYKKKTIPRVVPLRVQILDIIEIYALYFNGN